MDVDQDPESCAETNSPSDEHGLNHVQLPFPDPPEPAVSALALLNCICTL